MLFCDLLAYAGGNGREREMCVTVRSVETGREIATTYDVAADVGGHGELMLTIAVGGCVLSGGTSPGPSDIQV